MTHYFVACHLSQVSGQVAVGGIGNGKMTLTEVARFPNAPVEEDDSLHWDIPRLYHEVVEALRTISTFEEPALGISCTSWGSDYLLFGNDGALLTPTYHSADPRGEESLNKLLSKVPGETLFAESGLQPAPGHTVVQLAAEKSRRLRNTRHLLPVADGFNYLLSGRAAMELTQAGATQLFNPATGTWSHMLCDAVHLPSQVLPELVPAGTLLGPLRTELAKSPGLEDTRVVASCSHESAAALAVLPGVDNQDWAFLRPGEWTMAGTALPRPILEDRAREGGFSNEIGYGGSVLLQKHAMGLWMLNECRRFWEQKGCGLDDEMLTHLAGSAPPFESLIDPADPRFLEPGDMPMKIQAFCKETYQAVPRKPGAIIRCVLESLAFLYRRLVHELQDLSGKEIARLYVLGGTNRLLNHFTANALQIPVIVVPPQATLIGNVLVQALGLGQVKRIEEARMLAATCAVYEKIEPHTSACLPAYERLEQLLPCPAA